MRTVVGALCALLLALAPLPLGAQEGDAFVLPPGMLRLRAGGIFSDFDARFAPGGGTEPLTADLATPLTSRSFAPLRPLEAQLNQFLTAAGGSSLRADPQTFQLGTPDAAAAANVRAVPLSAAFGLLPRVEVEVTLPLLREEVLYTRRGLTGGTLGRNPAPARNAQLLAQIGEQWAALGRTALLPTDSSALGRELQRLVGTRLPGQSLDLPDSAARFAVLDSLAATDFGLVPPNSRLSAWQTGDLEVTGRVQLLSTLGRAPVPADSARLHYRAALSVSARIPTGAEPDSLFLLSYLPEVGQRGFGIGLDGDLFVGHRFWTTLSVQYSELLETEVARRVVAPGEPFSSTEGVRAVQWTPGRRIALRLAPRFRLTDAIALGARYSAVQLGESSFRIADGAGDASVLNVSGGLMQSAGLGVRYSTLPAYWEGRRLLPVEVILSYEATLDAPERRPDAGTMTIQASLFHSLFGGRP